MTRTDVLHTALESVQAYPLRSAFCVLGSALGVLFLMTVVTLIHGVDTHVKSELSSRLTGLNTVVLTPRADVEPLVGTRTTPRLTVADAEWLTTRMRTPGILNATQTQIGSIRAAGTPPLQGVRIIKTTPAFFDLLDRPLHAGRVFSSAEAAAGKALVVLDVSLARDLFGERRALGRRVRLRGVPHRIIGILPASSNGLLTPSAPRAIVPLPRPVAPARARISVDKITYTVPRAPLVGTAQAELSAHMRVLRELRPAQPRTFTVESSSDALSFWNQISSILMIALPGLVSTALIVSSIVIANIMLISVTERTAEVGLRKAMGAHRRDIFAQFVAEATLLAGLGGSLGIGLGIGAAYAISWTTPLPAVVAPWSIGLGLLLSLGIGVCAGVYPALRASRLSPIQALSHD